MQHISLTGIGLFTGADVRIAISPADATCFAPDPRAAPHAHPVHATIDRLDERPAHPAFAALPARHTCLADGDVRIATVEHALAAATLAGVHARFDLTGGGEVPIFDGSAAPFYAALRDLPPAPPAPAIPVTTTLHLEDGRGGSITIEPPHHPDELVLAYHLDYPAAGDGRHAIPPHTAAIDLRHATPGELERVARARTFSLASEVRQLHALGLFSRFRPADLLVINDDPADPGFGTPVENHLHEPDEPALHKLLDLVGDLTLGGLPRVRARITASRSGHALNHAAARAIRRLLPPA